MTDRPAVPWTTAATPAGNCWQCGGQLYENLYHSCTTSVRFAAPAVPAPEAELASLRGQEDALDRAYQARDDWKAEAQRLREELDALGGMGECPSCKAREALAGPDTPAERVTHGRHCPCSACAREDWTRMTGPCGMHGADCPAVYAPLDTPADSQEDKT